jgi:hypothetical protein
MIFSESVRGQLHIQATSSIKPVSAIYATALNVDLAAEINRKFKVCSTIEVTRTFPLPVTDQTIPETRLVMKLTTIAMRQNGIRAEARGRGWHLPSPG